MMDISENQKSQMNFHESVHFCWSRVYFYRSHLFIVVILNISLTPSHYKYLTAPFFISIFYHLFGKHFYFVKYKPPEYLLQISMPYFSCHWWAFFLLWSRHIQNLNFKWSIEQRILDSRLIKNVAYSGEKLKQETHVYS